MRRGGATHALSKAMSEEEIRLLGHWKSNAYRLYLDTLMKNRIKNSF